MTHKTLILLIVLAVCAVTLPAVSADVAETTVTTVEPTVVTETPTVPPTVPTVVTIPTTEPTTVPTSLPTTVPTIPTMVTQPTTMLPTTEPTITLITIIPTTQTGGGKGYIDTYCNVDGAAVAFDGSYQCTIAQGICTVGVSPTGTPVQTVSVTKSGYTTWSGPLSHMPANGEHVAVYSTINPVTAPTTVPPVQYGAIYAQSSPAGAAIYLNGIFQGYSPMTIQSLAPATYSMKASLNGYTSNTQLIPVYSGQTAAYYPVLQPSPPAPRSTGTVYVTSTPSGALIYADGNYQGKTPLTVTLYPGSHSFRLTLPGYSDYTATVYVNANTNQNLNANMGSAVYGSVSVNSMPGANVFMDSNSQGKIPASGSLSLYNVVSGNHLFKVTAPGYNEWMNTVYIQPNIMNTINAPLTPVGTNPTPVPATGGFDIASTPTGAEVYIDNLFKGYTPTTLTGIPAGSHQVLLKYTNYIDYSTTATVTAGQTTPLAISMQPAPSPTQKSPVSPLTVLGACTAVLVFVIIQRRSSP